MADLIARGMAANASAGIIVDDTNFVHKTGVESISGIKTFNNNIFAPNIVAGNTSYGGTISDNLDTITKNGFYTCYGTATGVPSSSYSWFITHQNSNLNTNTAHQRAIAYNSELIIYERTKISGTWNAWVLQSSKEEITPPTNYLYVNKGGNDSTGYGTMNKPFLTVQHAIDVATSGTAIFIYPGTYTENITFKAGVYLLSPVKFGVYIVGNHTANFSGTIVCDKIILQSSTGNTVAFSGSGAQNLQFVGSCSINSGTGDAINWTNTNASSKIYFEDGTCNVSTSGASARCFYSTTGAAGSLIANRVSFKVNNSNNVCLSIGGAVSFSHTSDATYGQAVVSGSATYTSAMVSHTAASVASVITNSTGLTMLLNCIQTGTAIPMVDGVGLFAESAIVYPSTGKGTAQTLNGGAGAIILNMASIKLRAGDLKPVVQDGLLEYDGTNIYFTVGTTRYKLDMTAV